MLQFIEHGISRYMVIIRSREMANTEKFKVLKAVHEAKNDARNARFDPSLNAGQKSVLKGYMRI